MWRAVVVELRVAERRIGRRNRRGSRLPSDDFGKRPHGGTALDSLTETPHLANHHRFARKLTKRIMVEGLQNPPDARGEFKLAHVS